MARGNCSESDGAGARGRMGSQELEVGEMAAKVMPPWEPRGLCLLPPDLPATSPTCPQQWYE